MTLRQQLELHLPPLPYRPIYSSLLSALPSPWIPRLSLLGTLGSTTESPGLRSSHSVVRDRWGHSGCVNTLDWEDDSGGGRLASAGDDTKICIWKPGLEPSTSFGSSPSLDYGLSEVIETGHRANIFGLKFAPNNSSRLFTCAGDSQVRIFDISNPSSASPIINGTRSWTHHDTSACIKVLRCHDDRVKRIATENSPDVFLTCSEDGTVRQHDLRSPHTCREGIDCGPPLLAYPRLALYSLSISKARPWMFVVAGTSRHAYLHDRRMVRSEMRREWGVEMEEGRTTQCVRRFGVSLENGKGETSNHVVATKLSNTNPRDLIISYSGDNVYLFDTDADPAPPPSPVSSTPPKAKRSHSSQGSVVIKRRKEDGSASASAGDGPNEAPEDATGEGEPMEQGGSGDEDEGSGAEEGRSSFFGPRHPRIYDPFVPVVHPRKTYAGHRNVDTVKDVNFTLADSHVVSGSDDGNFFVWERESAKLVGIFEGDSSVVNVLQPHPRLPILAISGIDTTIKIFGPTTSSSSYANRISDVDAIIERNRSLRAPRLGTVSTRALMLMLAGRFPEGRVEIDGEEADCVVM